jgi:predicted nucleic acid-binding protein
VIVDASVVVDAVIDPGGRGVAARAALAKPPATERLLAPGHFAFEVMSALQAAANRPGHPFKSADVPQAIVDAESLEIELEATPWIDVLRAWELSRASLRYADAIYVAAAERHRTALLTADQRIGRSRAPIHCEILTVEPDRG